MVDAPHISIIIPTYNEAGNLEELLRELDSALTGLDFQVIVVDDSSPDGTFDLVQKVARQNPWVQGIKRPGKLGLASAIIEGFRASNGELVVMMDADLSHNPRDLLALVEASRDADIVVGSRYVEGGSIKGWSPLRHLASRSAIRLSRALLGLSVRDTTSGFAIFRREILEHIAPKLEALGFKLLLEVLALSPNARIKEVPITFVNRKRGKSKFGMSEIIVFLRLCMDLRRHRKAIIASSAPK